jgi:hypothetical protein
MKKIVFYPILFSLNPILLLFASNVSDIPISELLPIILITPICAIGLMALLNRWLKDIHRAGFLVFLISLWFFHYGTIRVLADSIQIGTFSLGNHWILFPLWTLAFCFLSSGWLWRKITHPETITFAFNLISSLLIVFCIFRISVDLFPRYFTLPKIQQSIESVTENPTISNLPDIYYIILDGYAREDVLMELYHFDNSAFISALSNRGFYIASHSQSNYMQTPLSLASSLNMQYISNISKLNSARGPLIGMIAHSRVEEILNQLGYKFVAFSTGFVPTDLNNADFYLSSPNLRRKNDLEALLLINSASIILIEQHLIDIPISRYSTAQERISYIFKSLENEVLLINNPKFVFVHIIAPHPPFIFDQNGPVSPDEYYVLIDGNTFGGPRDVYIQNYIGQLIYINNRILQAIDRILANSKVPPIIIIQGDHGPGAYLDWNSAENTCLKERFSILNAYYLPQNKPNGFYDDITSVNTFPVILNTYFNFNFKLLSDIEYFSPIKNPYDFLDVSAEVQNPCTIH